MMHTMSMKKSYLQRKLSWKRRRCLQSETSSHSWRCRPVCLEPLQLKDENNCTNACDKSGSKKTERNWYEADVRYLQGAFLTLAVYNKHFPLVFCLSWGNLLLHVLQGHWIWKLIHQGLSFIIGHVDNIEWEEYRMCMEESRLYHPYFLCIYNNIIPAS